MYSFMGQAMSPVPQIWAERDLFLNPKTPHLRRRRDFIVH